MNKVDQLSDHISADIPDWTRESPRQFWDPGRKLLLTIRRYQMWCNKTGFVAVSLCKLLVIRHRFGASNAVVITDVENHAVAVGLK